VTLTSDLLTPKIDAFIPFVLVQKCINAESLVKSSPVNFKDIALTGPMVHFPARLAAAP